MDLRTPARWRLDRAAALLAIAAIAGCALPGPAGDPAPAGRPAAAVPAPPKLAGSSWYWLGTVTPAGLVVPADPGNFNLEFLEGGQMAAQLDCNRGGASWSQDGRSLKLGPLKTSRAACATGSEADRFARQLALVRGASTQMGLLEFDLGEAGSMVLARDPDWRLRSFDCPSGPSVLAAFGRDQAVVRWRGEAWLMRQQVSASGARYGAGNAILFSKGNEVTLLNEGKQLAGPCRSAR